MSQLANLGLYVPKGYIWVPSYHKYLRTHIFIFQNLMPSSFVRSSISSFIISKPKDVGFTPLVGPPVGSSTLQVLLLLWLSPYFMLLSLTLAPHQDQRSILSNGRLGSIQLRGKTDWHSNRTFLTCNWPTNPGIRRVTELAVEETEDPLGRYGQSISHVVIALKSTKGSKALKLDPSIHDGLSKEGVSVKGSKL